MDLVDCLQFCDKRYIATAHPDICRMLHFESSNLGNKLLKDIEKLRDKLAHSQDIVTGTTWETIIDLVDNVEKLIERSEKYVYETAF
jgi:hypothetical protein